MRARYQVYHDTLIKKRTSQTQCNKCCTHIYDPPPLVEAKCSLPQCSGCYVKETAATCHCMNGCTLVAPPLVQAGIPYVQEHALHALTLVAGLLLLP
jgi:hypothetical protein